VRTDAHRADVGPSHHKRRVSLMPRKRYVPPCDATMRSKALGENPGQLQRCWECFDPLPPAEPWDWLGHGAPGEIDRSGQTFKRFLAPGPHRSFPSRTQRRVYLMPLGDCLKAPSMEVLSDLLSRWLLLEVSPLKQCKAETKALLRNEEGCGYGAQIETSSAHELAYARKRELRDAFAVICYTMEDICDTQKGFQFLFGQAQLDKGVGIFSFARYADDSPSPARFLKRCGMVLVHEAFHLFGVKHCVFALCIMNGSNHLDESERRPFAMCPVDLRKLASTLDDSKIYSQPVDLEQRERSLLDFFEKHGLDDDARFTRAVIAQMTGQDIGTIAEQAVQLSGLLSDPGCSSSASPP